jgi:two-component system sensor histidine kinase HydH
MDIEVSPPTREQTLKLVFLTGLVGLTLAIHYGLVLETIFGHSPWIHAIHGRFCYIPIVIAAIWFGLRGALFTAAIISAAVIPLILGLTSHPIDISGELVEIVFYFAIAILAGALIAREWRYRRKQVETQRQLERAQRLSMIGQMAAGVAHEIKNPLASIKGAVEIMCDDSTPTNDRDDFRSIAQNEIRRVDSTIKEFLLFARPKESRFERLDLSDVIRTGLRQMESQLHKAGVTLEQKIHGGIFISGDAEKVQQVLLNLLLNAIDSSNSGSEIQVSLTSLGNGTARLAIADHGSGISEEDLQKVFDPFFTTKSSGTGLGLAIVKAIVEDHRGNIEISSTEGQGTLAQVLLPLMETK